MAEQDRQSLWQVLIADRTERGTYRSWLQLSKRAVLLGLLALSWTNTHGETNEWRQIYSVLASPRCLNCHTSTNYPRQGDERTIHKFGAGRGVAGHGAPALSCASCHSTANYAATGIPGSKNWHLAPLSMSWESAPGVVMSSASLCSTLKNRSKNGGFSLAALSEHHERDGLVAWAWNPGVRSNGMQRAVPPVPYADFVALSKLWVAQGGPCPTTAGASK